MKMGTRQEPHRPLLMLHFLQGHHVEPTIIVDITPVIDQRMKAVDAYRVTVPIKG